MTTRDPALQGGLFLLPLLLYLGKAAPRLLLTARPVLGMSFLSAGFIALFRTVIREQHAVMAMVAGMLDGLVQFHTRKEEEMKDGMRTGDKVVPGLARHRATPRLPAPQVLVPAGTRPGAEAVRGQEEAC